MTPIVHALRCSIVPLVLAAAAIAGVLLWRLQPPAQVVVMVPVSINATSAPAASPVAVPVVLPSWCYDVTWRHSSIDVRHFCGWR